jgi:hypothetical protein
MVFGNMVRRCEVIDFHYQPDYDHRWLRGMDPRERFGIALGPVTRPEGLPETAPIRVWNVFEYNHLYRGPKGIHIPSEAKHTILDGNAIFVEGDAIVDESAAATE